MANFSKFLISLSILLCVSVAVSAAEITIPTQGRLKGSIIITGELVSGDSEKLATLLNLGPLNVSPRVILNSLGGSVQESMQIAALVKAYFITTLVGKGSVCASACFFIFLAGDERIAAGVVDGVRTKNIAIGYLGLHRPYLNPKSLKADSDSNVKLQQKMIDEVATYLKKEHVSQRLIDEMMSRPSNDIYWMTPSDIEQLGVYNPGVEELLIARCGYSRQWSRDMDAAIYRQDSATALKINAKTEAFMDCSITLREHELNSKRYKLASLLKTGWRPWN